MAGPTEADAVPQHSVGIVGGRGAGKTVYLAAMYRYLSTQRENVGFYLNASPDKAKVLVAMFAELAGHKWLQANEFDSILEWDFSLWASGHNNRAWAACQFRYYDYAGGLIDHASPQYVTKTQEIAEKLKNCHAIVALMDGEKLSRFVLGTNTPQRSAFIYSDIPNIINAIKPAVASGGVRSLQFVVTKWDFVERAGATLKDIKDFLLSLDDIKNFLSTIHTEQDRITAESGKISFSDTLRTMPLIRLIPVSSVGFSFVEKYDPEDGMIIAENEIPKPWNVEFPLACIFVDVLKAEVEALKIEQDKTKKKQYSTIRSRLETLVVDVGRTILNHIPRKYLGNIQVINILHDLLEEKIYSLEERESDRYQKFLQIKQDSLRHLSDGESAFTHAAKMCHMMQQELDIRFPDNVIK